MNSREEERKREGEVVGWWGSGVREEGGVKEEGEELSREG
jgi:hypothetical protein